MKKLVSYITPLYFGLLSLSPLHAVEIDKVRTVATFVDEKGTYKDNGPVYGECRNWNVVIADEKSRKPIKEIVVTSVRVKGQKVLIITQKKPDPKKGKHTLVQVIDSSAHSENGIDGIVDAAMKYDYNQITGKMEQTVIDLNNPQLLDECQEIYDLLADELYDLIVNS